MAEKSKSEAASDKEFQVKFLTKLEQHSVADTPFTVPTSIDGDGLNTLVRELLGQDDHNLEFDWLCLGEILRGSLQEHVDKRNDITAETVIELEYIDKKLPPEPQVSSNHDDWVSSVSVKGDLVLTGCYDNTVNIWNIDGTKVLVIPGHTQPVKAVSWLSEDTFVSGGQDQTVNMFKWSQESNSVEMVNCCRGHERSVESVAVCQEAGVFATGSWDNTVKMWSAKLVGEADVEAGEEATQAKRSKGGGVTRTPLQTLGGHKEAVSGLAWLDKTELASASWDHTIKIWDMELGGLKHELVGNKAFFSLSYNPEVSGLLASSADRSVRMYDPRSGSGQQGQIVTAVYTSHTGWVSRVTWATGSPHMFVTASHDNLVKIWDARSFRTPLFDLTGHADKVLCCDWSNPEYIASGGADNDMKIFKSKIS